MKGNWVRRKRRPVTSLICHQRNKRNSIFLQHSSSAPSTDRQGLDIVFKADLLDLAEICLSGLLLPDSQFKSLVNVRGADAQNIANLLFEVCPLIHHQASASFKLIARPPAQASQSSHERRTRRRIERALRKLCGRAGTLPTAFYLSKEALIRTSSSPVACGGFADVYEGTFMDKRVAMKVLRVFRGEKVTKTREVRFYLSQRVAETPITFVLLQSFYKEVVFWKNLVHPNIVPFLGLADPEFVPLCMVSEWMAYGNLLTYLKIFPRANRLNLVSNARNTFDTLSLNASSTSR